LVTKKGGNLRRGHLETFVDIHVRCVQIVIRVTTTVANVEQLVVPQLVREHELFLNLHGPAAHCLNHHPSRTVVDGHEIGNGTLVDRWEAPIRVAGFLCVLGRGNTVVAGL
jgi:hypothetical protein